MSQPIPLRNKGRRIGPTVADESEHYLTCRACGQAFDMRDLAQMIYHEQPDHKPKPTDA